MTEPILEQVMQDVEDTLKGVAPPAYRNSFTVERESQTGNSPRDGLVVLSPGNPALQDDSPLQHDDYDFPILITAFAIESEDSGVSLAYRLASIAADIHKALLEDVHRGDVALNTTFPDVDQFVTAASPGAVQITAHVRFRTTADNPYQQ